MGKEWCKNNDHCDAIQSYNGKDWWSAQMQCYDNKFEDIWANFCWMEREIGPLASSKKKLVKDSVPTFRTFIIDGVEISVRMIWKVAIREKEHSKPSGGK